MENQPSNGKRAMEEELIKGCETANQLLEVLVHKSNTTHEDVELEGSVQPLVVIRICIMFVLGV